MPTPLTLTMETRPHAVMSLARARAQGLDVSKIRTCAVPDEGRVRGCQWAKTCKARMFSRPEYGGFGPQSLEPGTGGQGPEYVQFYQMDSASMSEREAQLLCTSFMSYMYDMYRQQEETGDRIVIYPPGTDVEMQHMLPVRGESGRMVLKTITETVKAVKFNETDDHSAQEERAAFRNRIAEKQRQMIRNSRLTESVEEHGGEVDLELPAATAAPVPSVKGPRK